MGKITEFLKPLEVKHSQDEYASIGTSRWGNRDIYPVIKDHQTYTAWSYFIYWATAGICISSWTLGSSMVGIGLTAGQACGAVLLGSSFAALLGFMSGQCGRIHHLGFMIMSRAAFGLWGSYFSMMLCVFESVIYFGLQSYFGGQAIVIILNSVFPSFLRMENTLPESAHITAPALIGFLLYFVLYIPVVWFVPPHEIHKYLYPNFMIICATFAGILGYFMHANGGPGDLVKPSITLSSVERGFVMMSCISSTAGAYTGGSVRVSDWTRFTKTRNAPVVPLIISMPLNITIAALVGVLVTSAAKEMYGEIIWSPLTLLQYTQAHNYTAACRAGTFFAGLGLLSSQIFENVTQNGITQGMDIAGMVPKYFSMRRGAILVCIIGIIIQPWRFLTQAATFLTVLSSFGVFIAPMTGILCTDFWLIRNQKLKIPDLYTASGIYWYTFGWNWRAFVSFFVAVFPSMPGFVCAVNGAPINIGWTRIYQLSYFVGISIAGVLYYGFCYLFPPTGLGIQEKLGDAEVIDGVLFESPASSSAIDVPRKDGLSEKVMQV